MIAIPLSNVYAEKDLIESQLTAESVDTCRATYSVEAQTLTMPCVEMSGESVSYAVQMQQVAEEPLSFALIQVQENQGETGNACRAEYNVLKGQLSVPCVSVKDERKGKNYIELNFSKKSNLFVVVENNVITTRQSRRSCPTSSQYDRKTNGVSFTDYGYANPLDNFIKLYVAQPFFSNHYFSGKEHLGIDYMISASKPVYAICDGSITRETGDFTFQKEKNKRGNYDAYFNSRLILDCGNFLAIYGHVDKAVSGTVTKGQKIAVIAPAYKQDNKTRDSNNDHLHFGITTASRAIPGTDSSGITWGFGIARPANKVNYDMAVNKGYHDAINYLCKHPVQAVRLELDSEITVEPNPVIQGQPVTIRAKISNRGGTKDFKGNLFAAFHKKGDSYSSQFDIKLEDKPLGKGQDYEYTFRDVINLRPGEYDLYIKGDDFQALPRSASYLQNPIRVRVISADVGHSELSPEDKANKIFDRVEMDYSELFSNRLGNTAIHENQWFYRVYDYRDQTKLYLAISKNGLFKFNNGKKWQDITGDFEAANTQICNGECW